MHGMCLSYEFKLSRSNIFRNEIISFHRLINNIYTFIPFYPSFEYLHCVLFQIIPITFGVPNLYITMLYHLVTKFLKDAYNTRFPDESQSDQKFMQGTISIVQHSLGGDKDKRAIAV
jgi:hypothetical protein